MVRNIALPLIVQHSSWFRPTQKVESRQKILNPANLRVETWFYKIPVTAYIFLLCNNQLQSFLKPALIKIINQWLISLIQSPGPRLCIQTLDTENSKSLCLDARSTHCWDSYCFQLYSNHLKALTRIKRPRLSLQTLNIDSRKAICIDVYPIPQYGHSQSEKKLGLGDKYHPSIKVHT